MSPRLIPDFKRPDNIYLTDISFENPYISAIVLVLLISGVLKSMPVFRALVISLIFVFSLVPASAATDWIEYTPDQFRDAQQSGKTILVDVSADWCPTCKVQSPILDELASDERMQDVLFIRVDFDTHKDFLQNHRIPRQSTILVFDGEREIDRSIAETDRDRLRAFVFNAAQL